MAAPRIRCAIEFFNTLLSIPSVCLSYAKWRKSDKSHTHSSQTTSTNSKLHLQTINDQMKIRYTKWWKCIVQSNHIILQSHALQSSFSFIQSNQTPNNNRWQQNVPIQSSQRSHSTWRLCSVLMLCFGVDASMTGMKQNSSICISGFIEIANMMVVA